MQNLHSPSCSPSCTGGELSASHYPDGITTRNSIAQRSIARTKEKREMRLTGFILGTLLCLFTSILPATAQLGSGQLAGKVLDPSGAAVPNAQVTATSTDTDVSLHTMTTSSGDFVFLQLKPGHFLVDVTAANFKAVQRSGILVETGQHVTLDLTLELGLA